MTTKEMQNERLINEGETTRSMSQGKTKRPAQGGLFILAFAGLDPTPQRQEKPEGRKEAGREESMKEGRNRAKEKKNRWQEGRVFHCCSYRVYKQ